MVETIERNGVMFFKADEIFALLNLTWRNTTASLKRRGIPDKHIRRSRGLFNISETDKYKSNEPVFIEKQAVELLICLSTKASLSEVNKLKDMYNLNINVYSQRFETFILDIIESIIKNHQESQQLKPSFLREHKFGEYRVDMFIPELNLIVEIDENCNHTSNRQLKLDKERSEFILSMNLTEHPISILRINESNCAKALGNLTSCLNFDNDIQDLKALMDAGVKFNS